MYLSRYFWQKPVLRWLPEVQKLGSHSFPCVSLLLSTIMVNAIKQESDFVTNSPLYVSLVI